MRSRDPAVLAPESRSSTRACRGEVTWDKRPRAKNSADAARTISMLRPTSDVHTSSEFMCRVSHCRRADALRGPSAN
ncbi:hypothetical protein GY45DRAFT_1323859 [Cubamyces sp. BRFM 1775]|nr:hypothetical protein GY45DRAFT_1323859 [Cubamyces sp. BRFM 1775]